MMNTKCKRRCN